MIFYFLNFLCEYWGGYFKNECQIYYSDTNPPTSAAFGILGILEWDIGALELWNFNPRTFYKGILNNYDAINEYNFIVLKNRYMCVL